MRLLITQTVDVDDDAWATVYYLPREDADEISRDVVSHLPELLTEAAQAKARQLGTFQVQLTNVTVLIPPAAPVKEA